MRASGQMDQHGYRPGDISCFDRTAGYARPVSVNRLEQEERAKQCRQKQWVGYLSTEPAAWRPTHILIQRITDPNSALVSG